MKNDGVFTDRRLLQAIDLIDPKFIAEVFDDLKVPDTSKGYVSDKRGLHRAYRQFLALAACLILLSAVIPIAHYVLVNYDFQAGGWGSGTKESSELLNTEFTEPVETDPYSISQAELNEINAAWAESQNNEKAIFCSNIEDLKYLSGYCCFYGKYNGCIILARRTAADFYSEINVNGYVFKLPSCYLWVCKNSKPYSLSNAYEYGWLSDADIDEIFNTHNLNIYGESTN